MYSQESIAEGNIQSNIPDNKRFDVDAVLSDALWLNVFDQLPEQIAYINTECNIVRVNSAMAETLGVTSDYLVGKRCYDFIHPDRKQPTDCPISKILLSGNSYHTNYSVTVPESKNCTAIPVFDSTGHITGIIEITNSSRLAKKPEISITEAPKQNEYISALPDPVLFCDIDGNINYASARVANIFGFMDTAALSGSNFLTLVNPDQIEKALGDIMLVAGGKETTINRNYQFRRADKDTFLGEAGISPVLSSEGEVKSLVIQIRDISNQIKSDTATNKNLIRSAKLFKTFINFEADPNNNIKRLIALYGEMLGASACMYSQLDRNDLVHLTSWKSPFLASFDPNAGKAHMKEFFIDKGFNDYEVIRKPALNAILESEPSFEKHGIKSILGIQVKNNFKTIGLITVFFTHNYTLQEEDREFSGILASAIAVEESRNILQQEKKDSEYNYRELFDSISDSIILIEPGGKILDNNQRFVTMFGYSKEEITGKSFESLLVLVESDCIQMIESISKSLTNDAKAIECQVKRKSGEEFPAEINLTYGRNDGKDVVVVIVHDISDYKRAEQKLQEVNKELQEINQSKDKFFSILAHDLKNQFQGLIGFMDLLVEDIDELDLDQIKEYVNKVRTTSNDTYSLLENLLAWSRLQTGKMPFNPSVFKICDEIDAVISFQGNRAIGKGITLVNKSSSNPAVFADRNMVRSILQNLISNAIKFSTPNSLIKIDIESIQSAQVSASNLGNKYTSFIAISVADNGVGISEDMLEKLFHIDGQVSTPGTANETGTGLGLILVKEMVEQNAGSIWVDSKPGRGSTFTFKLPENPE
jgi:two-component system, sensor histidine kinase and response regulator